MQQYLEAIGRVEGSREVNPDRFKLVVEGEDNPLEPAGRLNPTDIKISRSVTWSPCQGSDDTTGTDYPTYNFNGGSDTLDFSFMLDASETDDDLQDELAELYGMTTARKNMPTGDAQKRRAPVVTFQYGDFKFQGVITKIDFDVTLFSRTGAFKRASVTLSMEGRAFPDNTETDKFFVTPEELQDKETASSSGGSEGTALGEPLDPATA